MSIHGKFFFIGGRGAIMGVGGNFTGSSDSSDSWQPAADLLEVENGFLIQMDLPGVDAGSVEAVLDGQTLTVRGIRRALCPRQSKRYIHMEVARGEFTKIINLPEPVEQSNIHAELTDGVLEIFLPFGKRALYTITTLHIPLH